MPDEPGLAEAGLSPEAAPSPEAALAPDAVRSPDPAPGAGETVAVVLSGAVARGAFQAGALAHLIPLLEQQGLAPSIWLGCSAGSINAALWGSWAHVPAERAAEEVLGIWRAMDNDNVYERILAGLPVTAGQFMLGALFGVGPGTTSLLDTGPLHRTADDLLDTDRLATNVRRGNLRAIGVVATRMPGTLGQADLAGPAGPASLGSFSGLGAFGALGATTAPATNTPRNPSVLGSASGRSVLFLDEHEHSGYSGDANRALDVVPGPISVDHVLASSAFPVAFPPQKVTEPTSAAGWYLDGGMRLNTPLLPAVNLGATKIIIVSATSVGYGESLPPDPASATPDVADAAAQVMHAVLADRATEDLGSLRRINRMVETVKDAVHRESGKAVELTDLAGNAYRKIEYMVISPPAGEMGMIANDIFERRTSGLGRLREMDNWLIGQMLRGAGDALGRRELLSYLFFDQEYFRRTIELGKDAAAAALAGGWRT